MSRTMSPASRRAYNVAINAAIRECQRFARIKERERAARESEDGRAYVAALADAGRFLADQLPRLKKKPPTTADEPPHTTVFYYGYSTKSPHPLVCEPEDPEDADRNDTAEERVAAVYGVDYVVRETSVYELVSRRRERLPNPDTLPAGDPP